jgi:hypothetical protein
MNTQLESKRTKKTRAPESAGSSVVGSDQSRGKLIWAWAAAKRATGTR